MANTKATILYDIYCHIEQWASLILGEILVVKHVRRGRGGRRGHGTVPPDILGHHPPPSILLFSHFSTSSHPFPHLHRNQAFVNRLALYPRHDSTFEAFAPECFAQCSLWRWPLPGSATWYPGHPRVQCWDPTWVRGMFARAAWEYFHFTHFTFATKWFWVFSGFCLSLQGKNAFWDISR